MALNRNTDGAQKTEYSSWCGFWWRTSFTGGATVTEHRHERQAYQSERDALRDERKKLLQAHYAGVVPLDLLGEEQARIARRLRSSMPRSTPAPSSTNRPRLTSTTASPSPETATPST